MRFFKTGPHDCSYLHDRQATTVFLDPAIEVAPELYEKLNLIGFRRSGSHFYRPDCGNCQQCLSLRVRVPDFRPRRRHRRVARKATKVRWRVEPVHYEARYWDLYEQYINQRHAQGDMYPPVQEDFYRFLMQQSQYGFLLEGWDDSHLLMVAVVDRFSNGLSAVYTFFDPAYEHWSPGTLAILQQIKLCQEMELEYLYLGYWLADVPNMRYKADFSPAEIYQDERWQHLVNYTSDGRT